MESRRKFLKNSGALAQFLPKIVTKAFLVRT